MIDGLFLVSLFAILFKKVDNKYIGYNNVNTYIYIYIYILILIM